MTKPWDPGREAGIGRHRRGRGLPGPRWPARGAPLRISGSELRLMLLAGMFVGLAATGLSGDRGAATGEGGGAVLSGAGLGVRVIDGDTFDLGGERIRIADIDTPEVEGRCAHESALAARATDRLEALLGDGGFALHPLANGRDEDRYGRKLRIVTRDGRSIGDTLVAEGLARTWTGRREPWCG